MVSMSLSPVTEKLTAAELEICLIAVDVFNTLLQNKKLQPLILATAIHSEDFFGIEFNLAEKLTALDKFSDEGIGLTCDKLFSQYEALEYGYGGTHHG